MRGRLEADILVDRRTFRLDVGLSLSAGSTLALLGPNGAGKSTTLRALAGLVRLSDGSIRLGDEVFDDGQGFVPPERRAVGVVFQDYLLFPHLSALENVAFGLRARGVAAQQARARASEWLERVGLGGLSRSLPAALSGGQAQRVALARALVLEPRLLLLDEPLAALDAETRPQLRSELATHLAEFDGCAVLVSHDPVDALVLADELVVLEGGSVVQRGTPRQVALSPATDYVARLMGLNLIPGEQPGERRVFSPDDAILGDEPDPDAASWPGTVASVEQQLSRLRIGVAIQDGTILFVDLAAPEFATLRPVVGARVRLSVPRGRLRSVPA
jgi:molybdate transport system ATP-binding protein